MGREENYILNWIDEISKKRDELGGHAVCPYAKNSKYKIIKCKSNEISPIEGYDVIVFVIEDQFSLEEVNQWVEFYNQKYKNWLFFEDCKNYDTFIQKIQTNNQKYNLIIGQPREKLRNFREKLAKTDYYSYWEEEYLKEILEDDINLLN